MNLHLQNKVVLITGGAKGIGQGITRAFAAEGATAVILDRNAPEAEDVVREIAVQGQHADFFHVQMTNENEVCEAVRQVAAKYGCIDVVVNNAGGNDGVCLRNSPAEFSASLHKNLVHCFSLAHYALDHLIASRGCIVNIGSKTAETGQGGTSGYAAAKGGLNALTREWAVDLAKFGIRVNCIVPAEVITPLYERWLAQAPDPVVARQKLDRTVPFERRTTTVEEIANAVVFVASPRSSHTTGQILFVDGGYVHLDRACTSETDHLKATA